MINLKKVKVLRDNDSHWFVVPEDVAGQFYSMLRDCEASDDYEPFEVTFGKYRTGGDLNLVQLYAEI